jgi:hypothetical protein
MRTLNVRDTALDNCAGISQEWNGQVNIGQNDGSIPRFYGFCCKGYGKSKSFGYH